jgi:hypothetical protein
LLKAVEPCRKLLNVGHATDSAHSDNNARTRLAALGAKRSATKAARLRSLWPEIQIALDNGHSLKTICECLATDDLNVSVQSLGVYMTRMRRKQDSRHIKGAFRPQVEVPMSSAVAAPPVANRIKSSTSSSPGSSDDPLAHVRERLANPALFDYRPEAADARRLI